MIDAEVEETESSTDPCEVLDLVLGTRGRWSGGDGPVWPVTESVALFSSECLLCEILASRKKERPGVDLLLGGPSTCVSS